MSPIRAGTPVEAALTDEAWLSAMLDAEVALACAQARIGMIPWSSADAIAASARGWRCDPVMLARRAREAANPVVALVQELTREVAGRYPDAADDVHLGSTSQDILDTATMLLAAHALDLISDDLDRVCSALEGLAERHRDTPMAARTLTQHAVPTTFGLKAAGWLHAADGARQRLKALRTELPVQLGGAAGTLAAYHEYATLDGVKGRNGESAALELMSVFAEEVGLAEPVLPWHSAREPVARVCCELAVMAGVLGKFGTDVQNLVRTEVAEAVEPGAEGRGASSAMPQKRNPVLSALLVSAALQLPSHATVLLHCMAAEGERSAGAWHAEWQPLREALRIAGGAAYTAAELAEGLVPLSGAMARNLALTQGQIVAERLVVHLRSAVGKAEAKRHLGRIAASSAGGESFACAVRADPVVRESLSPDLLDEILDPAGYQGAAGELVDRALTHHRLHTRSASEAAAERGGTRPEPCERTPQ
ncbi:adenylosuccinate lyase family protein [Streptomyces rimosus]|uniref:class-II fumarase/aspartase family protein n=1 Tax=Streptomyces rimosus TaxID=1927 RepID=UPI00067C738D|nr:adenylosuccinate lyase family protein [Streptomyces rimosus]